MAKIGQKADKEDVIVEGGTKNKNFFSIME